MVREFSALATLVVIQTPIALADSGPLTTVTESLGGAGSARSGEIGMVNIASAILAPGLVSYSELSWREGFGYSTGVLEARSDSTLGALFAVSHWENDEPPTLSEMPGWVVDGEELTNHREYTRYVAGAGMVFGARDASLGATFSYQHSNTELGGEFWTPEIDASAAAKLADGVYVAASGRGLLESGLYERELTFGLHWAAPATMAVSLDAAWVGGEMEGRAGGELLLGGAASFRGGYSVSESRSGMGLGLSLLGEGTSFDYTFTKELKGALEGITTHSIGLKIAIPEG